MSEENVDIKEEIVEEISKDGSSITKSQNEEIEARAKARREARRKRRAKKESTVEPSVKEETPKVTITKEVSEDSSLKQLRLDASKLLKLLPVGWSKNECINLLENNVIPEKTKRDNWVHNDYLDRDVSKWDVSLLLDYMEGLIHIPKDIGDEDIWFEIYQRYQLAEFHYKEDVKDSILDKKPLVANEDGVYVRDAYRESKSLNDWSFFELKALIMEKLESSYSVDDAKSALVNYLTDGKECEGDLNMEEVLVDNKGVKSLDMITKSRLDEYLKLRESKDNKYGPDVGMAHANLVKYIISLFDKPYVDFRNSFNILLDFVNSQRNGIFSSRRCYLHWEYVPLQGDDLRGAETLFGFLLHVSKVEYRTGGRTDTNYIATQARWFLKKESQIEKLIQFFS